MRIAFVSVLAALLGGLAALGIGWAAGWFGDGETQRVVTAAASKPLGGTVASVKLPRVKPLLGNGFDPAGIYAARASGVVTIYATFGNRGDAQGSGFVVSGDGLVLTSSHVITTAGEGSEAAIEPATRVYVQFFDGDRVPARIVGWDVFDDVGVVRVDPKSHPLQPVPLGESSQVRVGEPIAAIGSPFGNENSLAVGVVSAVHRSIDSLTSRFDLVDAIQVDAPINRGNSGGPVFDARGRVIGIAAQIRSDSGTAEGVGFAVPIDSARRSLEQLVARGSVAYAFVGISTVDLTRSIARHLGLSVRAGALIDAVETGSAADRAGLRGGAGREEVNGVSFRRGGDVVLAVDGAPVRSGDDLVRIVTGELEPGRVSTFTILREGKRVKVRVLLDERRQTSG